MLKAALNPFGIILLLASLSLAGSAESSISERPIGRAGIPACSNDASRQRPRKPRAPKTTTRCGVVGAEFLWSINCGSRQFRDPAWARKVGMPRLK